ncbi:MAG TPA: DUF1415 domain-containing protein [Ideonella sp.]|uniref:DUF1415 domain-containing protein n=1 Tax=Ideonella sp. TaxID=1929293 RepID=UPI002C3F8E7E|nr:DUF1415 domain-containing protein [Ideonella sp.]HSI52242.1 DUF1415 domain-containing protein [Ideonella sp.]
MPASDTSLPFSADDSANALLATQRWLETAVIGLNLCPFAKAVWAKQQVRIVVTDVDSPEALVEVLRTELRHLAATDAETTDTTLIVHPRVLQDFLDFNDFLGVADGVLVDEDLEGELQVASFHPQFQFEGTAPDDMGNFSNRSPYPTLHLLREDSIDRAVEAFPEAEAIYERNIETLEKLGPAGWQALFPPR